MPQTSNISVSIEPVGSDETIEFENINYISFISSPGGSSGGTYGKPAIIAPGPDHVSAQDGPVTVLYINPANIVAVEATRHS